MFILTSQNKPQSMNRDVLLVFDLNRTLIKRTKNSVICRKYLKTFLEYCFSKYSIGIYTSMVKHNTDSVLKSIMTEDQLHALMFIWDREYTYPDPEPITKWDTIKYVSSISKEYPGYKILLIDDEFKKVRFNDDKNILVVTPFEDKNDDLLLEIIARIEIKIKLL